MLALSWFLYLDGTLSLAMFIGMLLFIFELFTPIKAFYNQVARLTVMNACLDRIESVFAEAELNNAGTGKVPAQTDGPEIEFKDVSFGYDEREVLKGISFSVSKDSMTALVGPSGSGKTTVDTVYNNISIGRMNATREEVEEAAKKARCYDFIMQLPDGFDTVIGEGGASLSGGEQQRISIARCILKDAPIVILDEATASVDADSPTG